jgi:tetratricopeptide (TPR) repeat protein
MNKGKAAIAAFIPAILISLPFRTFAGIPSNSGTPSLNEIDKFYDATEYVKALDGLLEIIEANPNDAEAKLYMRKIAKQLQQREIDILLTSPVDREAMVREAWRHLKKTPPSAIQEAWSKIDSYMQQRHFLFAGDLLTWIVQNSPEGSADFRKASKLLDKIPGKLAKKANSLAAAVQIPYIEGWQEHRQKKLQTAIALWREVFDVYPEDDELKEMIQRDEVEIAGEKRHQEFQQHIADAREDYRQGYYAEAIDELQKALEFDPQNADLDRELEEAKARLKIQKGIHNAAGFMAGRKYPQAIGALTDILQADPKNAQALAMLTELEKKLTVIQKEDLIQEVAPAKQGKKGKPVKAVIKPAETTAAVQTPALASSVSPKKISVIVQSNAYYNRGLMLYASDHLNNAVDEFRKAIDLNPENEKARRALDRVKAELKGTLNNQ